MYVPPKKKKLFKNNIPLIALLLALPKTLWEKRAKSKMKYRNIL